MGQNISFTNETSNTTKALQLQQFSHHVAMNLYNITLLHMQASGIHIIIILSNYSCVSICPSITEGQQKRFDHKTQDPVSLATDG